MGFCVLWFSGEKRLGRGVMEIIDCSLLAWVGCFLCQEDLLARLEGQKSNPCQPPKIDPCLPNWICSGMALSVTIHTGNFCWDPENLIHGIDPKLRDMPQDSA
ncbi:hypothetical protein Salat_1095700 [Sesamum alatum]|uniref:Uncharacterized protein n=1 Tax=Sesamum alatum TaxID=300844 RepID=A0AAE1YMW4_9LAMI|nr:hypothetical protein Salat_1095700 [Sesamum alatum]